MKYARFGRTRLAASSVPGRDDLAREGRAQQDKAENQRDVAKKEAEAEKSRATAPLDGAVVVSDGSSNTNS